MARNPNRMIEAAEKLTSVLKFNASILITIQQDGVTLNAISASVSRTDYDVMQGEVMTAFQTRDYTVETSDLNGMIPKSGMVITESNGDRYVAAILPGINVYENYGPTDSATKIHTKAIS